MTIKTRANVTNEYKIDQLGKGRESFISAETNLKQHPTYTRLSVLWLLLLCGTYPIK